jgi:carbamoyl-phosphate synthase large subunit
MTRNVLIFPAGTEIGLEIFQALQYCKEVKLFGAGQAVSNHAQFLFEPYYEIPSIHDDNWIETLVKLCNSLNIDYIFPAYDDVINALCNSREKIPAEILAPNKTICDLTRSKRDTYKFFESFISVPKVINLGEKITFPVFIKPDKGQGSQNTFLVNSQKELFDCIHKIEDPLVCEYLPGEEYTVDCFSDRDLGLIFCGARERQRTRNGISMRSQTTSLSEAHQIAKIIQDKIGIYGAWFFQIKRNKNGRFSLLEIAPRIAGSMATHRIKGVNFPLLTILEAERKTIQVNTNDYEVTIDRALKNRFKINVHYYDTIYIDLDDTLIVHNKVNPIIIQLIFQGISNGKKIVLITRHAGDLDLTLNKFRLNHIFHQIIHLNSLEKKSSYIKNHSAIFIDDSFSERMDVHDHCQIMTFDTSMVECLLD